MNDVLKQAMDNAENEPTTNPGLRTTPNINLRPVTTPAAPLSDQITTYEKLRREIHERVRRQSLTIQSDFDRKFLELKTEFDRKESEELAKLRHSRNDAMRSLLDQFQQAKNENESLLLRLDD